MRKRTNIEEVTTLSNLKKLALDIRIETLEMLSKHGFGHVGGSLSIADAIAVLYGKQMKYDPKNPKWDGRDYLVLSKGHADPRCTPRWQSRAFSRGKIADDQSAWHPAAEPRGQKSYPGHRYDDRVAGTGRFLRAGYGARLAAAGKTEHGVCDLWRRRGAGGPSLGNHDDCAEQEGKELHRTAG
jgi:hypothetical protein